MRTLRQSVTRAGAFTVALHFFLTNASVAAPRIVEYTDTQYGYTFQYPSDWTREPAPPSGESGAVGILVRSPTKRSQVMAIIGVLGKSLTREQFESSPNREAGVSAMIEFAVEQVYKKLSRSLSVDSIIVSEKRSLPSDVGIMFYIATTNMVTSTSGKVAIKLAGKHVIPFGKDYMVSFIMVTPVDPTATAEDELLTSVFNSFHVAGELSKKPWASATCTEYGALTPDQKVSLAYGYLEGVQATLDKDPADVLVPPSDSKHPIWWVLPTKLGEKLFAGLADAVDTHCRSPEHRQKRLLDAFLSIANQKGGGPSLGISLDKQKTDPWKRFLGASVSCSAYNASSEGTRQAIVSAYHLGTEALRARLKMKTTMDDIAWPSALSAETVRVEVDKACQKRSGDTVRDVLWVTTVELGVKQGVGSPKGK